MKQLYTVSDDHIRADLRHPESHKLFRDDTIENIEERLGNVISASSNVEVEAAVHASRDEHMYVLNNDTHHVAIRSDDLKLPHPTLVGGDPDVDCAGTMRWGIDGAVIVDDGSGHFRPGGARPAEQKLNKIMNKTSRTSFKKKIKRGRRL